MFTLQKENVVKIVATESKRNKLISLGFVLVADTGEIKEKEEVKKRTRK